VSDSPSVPASLTGIGLQVGIAVLSDMLKLEVHGTNPVKQLLQVVRELPLANIPTLCPVFHFSGHGIQAVGPVAGGAPHLSVPRLHPALRGFHLRRNPGSKRTPFGPAHVQKLGRLLQSKTLLQ
jgi:hypothetical protein